jgi:beta-glucanase (GH16 family)
MPFLSQIEAIERTGGTCFGATRNQAGMGPSKTSGSDTHAAAEPIFLLSPAPQPITIYLIRQGRNALKKRAVTGVIQHKTGTRACSPPRPGTGLTCYKGCMMKSKWMIFFLAAVLLLAAGCQRKFADMWELVWSDEFDGDGAINPAKWTAEVRLPGWVNSERQHYTDRTGNVRIENGKLVIEALKETYKGARYTSARIHTQNTANWLYGRFEISAKLPVGRGTWPAIWMMPRDIRGYGSGWPASGEIDIMEHVGYDQGNVHASIHTLSYNWPRNTQKTAIVNVPDCSERFHLYALEWYEDHMDIYVDGQKYLTFTNERKTYAEWPFDKPFHLILNVAVGGGWGGAQGIDDTIFPQRMEVDYVRVYKLK